jgi:FAD:protein FMN transferase
MKKNCVVLAIPFILLSCGGAEDHTIVTESDSTDYVEFYGNTQGTTFAIICNDGINISNEEIEKILDDFDLALSSYVPNSIISELNKAPAGIFEYEDPQGYFSRCYQRSKEIFELSSAKFDPTVFPLVDAWGFFGEAGAEIPDSAQVDSLRALTGFEAAGHFRFLGSLPNEDSSEAGLSLNRLNILKTTATAQLGFDAIAQGLAVDVLAETLESRGAENYYVEIGGEIRVKGVNTEGMLWSIGIDKPIEKSSAENREIQKIVRIKDRSIATSGSYRKFYERDGLKYSHTIDPKTGYPVTHSLLSVSVIADDCATADAMATSFMVMGADSSMAFVKAHPELNLEVYLIFTNDKGVMETYYTEAFRNSDD